MNPGRYYHRYIKGKVLTNVSAFFNISKYCPFYAGIAVRFTKECSMQPDEQLTGCIYCSGILPVKGVRILRNEVFCF
jgi:hypothetical protein